MHFILRLQQMHGCFIYLFIYLLKAHVLVFYYVLAALFLLALRQRFITLFIWPYIFCKPI